MVARAIMLRQSCSIIRIPYIKHWTVHALFARPLSSYGVLGHHHLNNIQLLHLTHLLSHSCHRAACGFYDKNSDCLHDVYVGSALRHGDSCVSGCGYFLFYDTWPTSYFVAVFFDFSFSVCCSASSYPRLARCFFTSTLFSSIFSFGSIP